MHSDVDIVKSRTNIVDIVGEYVKLTKAGSSFKACCPFHQEKTPSFNVNEEKQMYHCFGCGVGGDVFSFVMEIEGMGFRETLEMLADKAGVELQNNFSGSSGQSQDKKKKLFDVLELTTKFYEKQLWDGDGAKKVLSYLRDRGLSDEIIKKFRLGYAPDGWNHVESFLKSKEFDNEIVVQTGTIIKSDKGSYYDRFRNRIMFPITDAMGRVIGFTSRVLPDDDESQAKYINTPETYLYHKGSVLYGIDHAKQIIKQENSVVVVEGNMDVIAAHDSDIENTIAVSGTAMTEEHIRILKRYTNHFILFFDADDAGQVAVRRSAILCLDADVQISMILLSEGKDAADIAKDNPEKLREIIQKAGNAIDVFINIAKNTYDLDDPHGKRQAIESITELIAHVASEIERDEWIGTCADEFNVTERVVVNAVKKQIDEKDAQGVTRQYEDTDIQADNKNTAEQSQMQRIYKSIILMMMAYPHVWEYVEKNKEKYGEVMNQRIIKALIREGPDCGFSVGEFVSKNSQRESLYTAAMKMQQKYEREHEDGGSPIDDTETYIMIALDTFNKRRIEQLVVMMNDAEENGDYDKQKQLLEQISTLSQQVIRNT
ncbi:MAG: DNA primase [Patescibacteria group bacterium]|nr:DNA primase [Patescibacteria group bacterium]